MTILDRIIETKRIEAIARKRCHTLAGLQAAIERVTAPRSSQCPRRALATRIKAPTDDARWAWAWHPALLRYDNPRRLKSAARYSRGSCGTRRYASSGSRVTVTLSEANCST